MSGGSDVRLNGTKMQDRFTGTWIIAALLIGLMMFVSYFPSDAPSSEVPISYEQHMDTFNSSVSDALKVGDAGDTN